MDAELRQVANGFDNKVRVFEKYDINGYRFRTVDKERKMADRKSTNSGVSAVGDGGIEYYGRVEAIYELLFYGENPPNVVFFNFKTARQKPDNTFLKIKQGVEYKGVGKG